jgi:hypothetical protein
MDQNKKSASGAPSSDTTSALFVSARKKQLEQQEAERRAKEKEDQRLAAEAEVRRLEDEVEERRRKAEEDKVHAEEEAKRIAEEARARQTQAAEAPDAVLGAQSQKKDIKLPGADILSGLSGGAAAKALPNKKLLIIIGAAVAAVLAIVILVVALGGNKTPYLTAGGLDIRGIFYSADAPGDSVSFFEDGTLEFQYADASLDSGKYSIKGETITIKAGETTLVFEALSDDTLADEFGALYTRTPEDAEWTLNPDAALDSTVIHETLAMEIDYPSSEMHIDDQGVISVATLTPYTLTDAGGYSVDEIIAVKNTILAWYVDNYKDVVVIEDDYSDSLSAAAITLNYEKAGETRYMGLFVKGWQNIEDGVYWYYTLTLDCPDAQSDVYTDLFFRIYDTRSDT